MLKAKTMHPPVLSRRERDISPCSHMLCRLRTTRPQHNIPHIKSTAINPGKQQRKATNKSARGTVATTAKQRSSPYSFHLQAQIHPPPQPHNALCHATTQHHAFHRPYVRRAFVLPALPRVTLLIAAAPSFAPALALPPPRAAPIPLPPELTPPPSPTSPPQPLAFTPPSAVCPDLPVPSSSAPQGCRNTVDAVTAVAEALPALYVKSAGELELPPRA